VGSITNTSGERREPMGRISGRHTDPEEEAIRRAKLGPGRRPPVHGELVAQGQVLEGELARGTGGVEAGGARG